MRDRVRTDARLGRTSDDELWRRLIPAHHARHDWQAIREAGYTCGPAEPHLRRWADSGSVWLLSNHRTHWLLPRLMRFGVLEYFERIHLSDTIGAAKPGQEAFDQLLGPDSCVQRIPFVDNQGCNVEAASQLGISALQTRADASWVASVYNSLYASPDGVGVAPGGHAR